MSPTVPSHRLSLEGIGFWRAAGSTVDVPLYRGRCRCKEWEAIADTPIRIRYLYDHEHIAFYGLEG